MRTLTTRPCSSTVISTRTLPTIPDALSDSGYAGVGCEVDVGFAGGSGQSSAFAEAARDRTFAAAVEMAGSDRPPAGTARPPAPPPESDSPKSGSESSDDGWAFVAGAIG